MDTSKMHNMSKIRRIIFHHADFDFESFPKPNLDDPQSVIKCTYRIVNEIDSWHMERWSTGLGYHYLIGNGNGIPDGNVAIGRPLQYRGAHVSGHNHDSVGIMLVGNLVKHQPTKAQIDACIQIANLLCKQFDLDPQGHYSRRHYLKKQIGAVISGHREWQGHETNDCPGSLLEYLPHIREEVAKNSIFVPRPVTVYFRLEGRWSERNGQ